MRILAVSDKVVPLLYGPSLRQTVGQVDLVLSCGDLPLYYIDYLASVLDVPCFLVHGNHAAGAEFEHVNPYQRPPRLFMDLDERTIVARGVILAGLEGSIRYNRNPRFQYTQAEMWRKAGRLAAKLAWNRLRYGRSLDILITHSPPAGIHDGPDPAHQGFESFLWLMRTFKPRYLLHGHKHVYRPDEVTVTQYGATTVVNVYPWRIVDL